jgi:uncharacterized protein (TIGR03663 family)
MNMRSANRAQTASQVTRSRPEVSTPVWRAASLCILLTAAFLRLYDYGLKPLHHDEGVNGFFLTRLFREGVYQYDPANYHGPTLYYFALLTTKLLGLNTFAIRLVPALFGVGTVWLVLCLRRHLGAIGALSAAALLAVSPGAVYLSRYFIHESQFVFFTLGIVVAALKFYEEAEPGYLLLASASAAMLFATKETAVISAGVLFIALICTDVYLSPKGIYTRLRKAFNGQSVEEQQRPRSLKSARAQAAPVEQKGLARFGGASRVAFLSLAAISLFVLLNVLFYSSFFTHSQGVNDAIGTFKFWTQTGKAAHVHPWDTYLRWLWQEEAPLLILGAAGVALAAWRGHNRFAFFAGLWTLGITAAYSLVPYKTPWLTLNLIVPLAISGGYALSVIYRWDEGLPPAAAFAVVLALALTISGYQTIQLNFYHYDDDAYPYVYAHTRREVFLLVNEIKRLAARAGTNEETTIAITSPEYWPLPWYLRDYKRVGYHGQVNVSGETLVIGSTAQEDTQQLQTALGDSYQRVASYTLRPGVTLALYVRRDALGAKMQ